MIITIFRLIRNNMKIYISIILMLGIVLSAFASDKVDIKTVTDTDMARVLALSEVMDLNKIKTPFEKNRWVKMYKVPGVGPVDCFPESHGICQYEYYLATSQIDDSPAVNAWNLGRLGEIIDYKWIKTEEVDSAIIIMKVSKYSKQAISYNKKLKNEIKTYRVIINNNLIKIEADK